MTIKHEPLPLYRQVLSDAWKLSLTHKHLWIFGFFATFIGYGGASEIILGAYNRLTDYLPIATVVESPLMMVPGFTTIRTIVNLSPYPAISLMLFTIAVLLLFGISVWIISTSINALIISIRKIERGGSPTLSDGLQTNSANIVRVLTLTVGAKLAIGLVFVLTSLNLLNLLSNHSVVAICFFFFSFILFTIIAVIISLISIYATNATVIENLPIVPSIVSGLKTLRKNWLISIEMVAILLVTNVCFGVMALLITMILSVPLIFFFFVAAIIKSGAMMTVMMTLTMAVLVIIMIMAGSFLTTFQASAWSLLWIKLSSRTTYHPKIIRLTEWFQKKFSN